MSEIHWKRWQREHIEKRHGVTATDFEEAWDDPGREDLAEEEHAEWGSFIRSIGATSDGRLVEMLWRWQGQVESEAVWPITAFFRSPPSRRQRRPPKEKS